jgi:hypothetical protein
MILRHWPCPWRIVSQGHNAFEGSDHGHQFGLPALIDGESEAFALLDKKSVRDVQVFAETAGITIWFEGGQRLEVINNSSGYEGWNLMGPKGFEVIAIDGGGLASGMQRCMAQKRAQTLRDNSNGPIRKSYSSGSQDLFGGHNLLDTHLGFVSMFPYRLPTQHYDS